MRNSSVSEKSPFQFRILIEVCLVFLKLGCMSFGGPVAHLGYFHAEFVEQRKWIKADAYADLVALCQFLPGPASSQVVYALGMHRAGFLGALGASICFLLPSSAAMVAFGYGVSQIAGLSQAGWVHGLKLAAVAVVSQAVLSMGQRLCPDSARLSIAVAVAAALIIFSGPLTQVLAIAAGALMGWVFYRHDLGTPGENIVSDGRRPWARVSLAAFILLLALLPLATSIFASKTLAVFDSFYRSGSLVFGGGHVVLPLLREEVVPRGWVTDNQFLAGYGAAQAVPGPLFTFASYLGTVMYSGSLAWAGGMLCTFAIFLPAWLLIGGALPYWHLLRGKPWIQSALRGANAAVVGVLLAALYSPVMTEGITGVLDAVIAAAAFIALYRYKVAPLMIVVFCAAAGQLLTSSA